MEFKKKLSFEKYQQLNLDISVKFLTAFAGRQDPEYFAQPTRRERYCFISKILARSILDELGFYVSMSDPMGDREYLDDEEEDDDAKDGATLSDMANPGSVDPAAGSFDRPITHLNIDALNKLKEQEKLQDEGKNLGKNPVVPPTPPTAPGTKKK